MVHTGVDDMDEHDHLDHLYGDIAGPSPQDSTLSFMLVLMPWIFLYIHCTATIWWIDHAYKTIQLLPPLQFPSPTVRKRPSCI